MLEIRIDKRLPLEPAVPADRSGVHRRCPPGDLLEVENLDVEAHTFGYTSQHWVREQVVVEAGGLAYPPTNPVGAVPGGTPAAQGLRTERPRENGGNLDINQTRVGSRVFFPVLVDGHHACCPSGAARHDRLSAGGWNRRQEAYALCSVAVDLRRECVNGPSAMLSALLPLDIFE